jgi:NAD(P)-dependent dehydrogenase (short-subunit alcohol dehydrogenase family)/alkylhydroperoxidase family enzyme
MNSPRVRPGTPSELGPVNALVARAIGRASRTNGPPNLFTTLGRHRRLFLPWLMFAGRLMPGGSLPRADTELVILRVAYNCGCEYEWRHHERLAQTVGLSADDVERVRTWNAEAGGFSEHQGALLRAADELHERREISEELWSTLSAELSPRKLIELCMLIGHYEMLAMTINSLRIEPDTFAGDGGQAASPLAGRRVLITGAARGIGAATAKRLHSRGARVVVAGIEQEELEAVAAECGGTLAVSCDVRSRAAVEAAVAAAVEHLGGLDVVIANAGVAAQLPINGGDPEIFERTIEVNLIGAYYTLRAAAPHISHPGGYALAISSLAAAVHPPLLGAYSASKAGVEALADSMRVELTGTGARVGVAYFAELDTDMTKRGFGTEAASQLKTGPRRVAPLKVGIDAIERGVARRARRVVAPRWYAPVLPARMLVQPLVDVVTSRGLRKALDVAREEHAPLTTPLP